MVYAPGTGEKNLYKLNLSLQQNATANQNNAANIATANTNITSNAAAITALQTAGTGLTNVAGSLAVSLPKFTNSLAGDVALNNINNYFDGPSVAQPNGASSGTWFVSGTVTCVDTAGTATFRAKLYDGTTVIASTASTGGINTAVTLSLSGYITNPAGNLRIAARDVSSASGKIVFNQTGLSMDATISAIRVA